jgi:membrane peptidoglycan carboxypeptidase
LKIDYPRAGRSGLFRFWPSWRQWLLLAVLGVAALVATFAVLYSVIKVPRPNDQALAQATIVYYADGHNVLARVGANRTSIPFAQMPVSFRDAVMSAEDRQFYQHGGFSVSGMVRSAWNDLRGGALAGGSTITQQLVKNYYLNQNRTISRKVDEFFVSIKIEQQLTKDQIFADYANTIYFGRGTYGVQAAAEAYFGVSAADLTPAQSAVLGAIIRSPGGYAPETNLAGLQARWRSVLDGEVTEGWMTQSQRDAMVFPSIRKRSTSSWASGPAGYLVSYVQAELAAKGFSEDDILRSGLRITTTFDRTAEASAIAAVNQYRPKTSAAGVRIGLASVGPATGGIVAMYGGAAYGQPQYVNDASQSHVQAGSTFKAFTLAAALENGFTLDSRWNGNSPREFINSYGASPYRVNNEDDHSYGRISLLTATEQSVNSVFVDVENQPEVTPTKVVDAARRAGIPASVPIAANLTATLGTASPTAVQMAGAYATFASGGLHAQPTAIAKVTSASGQVLFALKPTLDRVFSQSVVSEVDYALQHVVTDGTGYRAALLGRPVAGKTGTTDSNQSAWFVGYTPQLSTAVNLFRPSPDGRTNLSLSGAGGLSRVAGGSFPTQIWTGYMQGALQGKPTLSFPPSTTAGSSSGSGSSSGPSSGNRTGSSSPSPDGSPSPPPSASVPSSASPPSPSHSTSPTASATPPDPAPDPSSGGSMSPPSTPTPQLPISPAGTASGTGSSTVSPPGSQAPSG